MAPPRIPRFGWQRIAAAEPPVAEIVSAVPSAGPRAPSRDREVRVSVSHHAAPVPIAPRVQPSLEAVQPPPASAQPSLAPTVIAPAPASPSPVPPAAHELAGFARSLSGPPVERSARPAVHAMAGRDPESGSRDGVLSPAPTPRWPSDALRDSSPRGDATDAEEAGRNVDVGHAPVRAPSSAHAGSPSREPRPSSGPPSDHRPAHHEERVSGVRGEPAAASHLRHRSEPLTALATAPPVLAALQTALRWVSGESAKSAPAQGPEEPPRPRPAPPPAPSPQSPPVRVHAPEPPRPLTPRSLAQPALQSESARGSNARELHIGSIDIHVEPPKQPAPAPRRAAPAPRPSIARGFPTTHGFRQS
jgi:hypothetical protein